MKDADEGGGVASDDNETSRPGGPNDESLVFEQGTSGRRGGGFRERGGRAAAANVAALAATVAAGAAYAAAVAANVDKLHAGIHPQCHESSDV